MAEWRTPCARDGCDVKAHPLEVLYGRSGKRYCSPACRNQAEAAEEERQHLQKPEFPF